MEHRDAAGPGASSGPFPYSAESFIGRCPPTKGAAASSSEESGSFKPKDQGAPGSAGAPPYTHEYYSPEGRVVHYETVQDRLLNVFGSFVGKLWGLSETVVRADLVRPYNPKQAKVEGEEGDEAAYRLQRRGRREGNEGKLGGMIQGMDRGLYGQGAQIKLMQIWKFRDQETKEPRLPWALNFGVGANFSVDSGRLHLKARVRSKHAVVRLLPKPDLELRGQWQLGKTRIGVDVRYRVPIQSPDKFLEQDQAGYLSVRLFNTEGSGFSLSPDGGLEFDEQVVKVGEHTRFRVAAKLSFPRYFPWDEDEDPLTIEVRRLGLKTTIT